MTEVLDAYGIRCCVSLNLAVLEHYREIAEAMVQRNWDLMSHGIYNTRYLYSYDEPRERAFYRDCIDTLKRHTGKLLKGMLGPAISGTLCTPQLLAAAGLRYVCDWVNDEQLYCMTTSAGELVSLPIALELDDVHALWERRVPVDRYAIMLGESFAGLYQDGARTGRLLVLNLHPWLIGQPFRIGFLDAALEGIMRHQGVWAAHGTAIVDWFRQYKT